ncbi:MAG: hypothetical protein EBZ74_01290 [Planctomycetia bacterium]|nr:hypothetical protein [Planctomycetia bacterium]
MSSTVKVRVAASGRPRSTSIAISLPPWPVPQPCSTSTSNVPGASSVNVHSAASLGRAQKPSVCFFSAGSQRSVVPRTVASRAWRSTVPSAACRGGAPSQAGSSVTAFRFMTAPPAGFVQRTRTVRSAVVGIARRPSGSDV